MSAASTNAKSTEESKPKEKLGSNESTKEKHMVDLNICPLTDFIPCIYGLNEDLCEATAAKDKAEACR